MVEGMQYSESQNDPSDSEIDIRCPTVTDGAEMWRLTKATGVLDLNSSYQYLLWGRDFSATSVVAIDKTTDQLLGFITGYMRPDATDTLFVWQVAVAQAARGLGLASRMLEQLIENTSATSLETTVTDDNEASKRLFASMAKRHDAGHQVSALFTPELYPDGHDTEFLHRIGPLKTAPSQPGTQLRDRAVAF